MKLPSMLSPKCLFKMASACSEPLPGTANEVESNPVSLPAENAPNRAKTIQQATTAKRQRTT